MSAGQSTTTTRPKVTDHDNGEITINLGDHELRGYSYKDDAERRIKMRIAWEYIEGWCDGKDAK